MSEGLFWNEKQKEADEASVERAMSWMSRNIPALAQAIANRQHVEQYLKVVEAEQKAVFADQPAHAQERNARASQAYRDTLEAYREASEQEQRLRYNWQLAETVIEVWRTKCANERKIA